MKILITGGSSLLGKSLLETAPPQHQIESTWYTNYTGLPMYQMDVCDKSQVRYVFDRIKPEIVIHCAANGSVDYAEQNYREAHRVNVGGVENILWAARDFKAKVVYISTNAVFAGDNPPYAEDSPLRPVNAYGKQKLKAEQVVRDSLHWIIIRPFLLYGWPWPNGRGNWAKLVVDKLSQDESLKLVDDVIWQPTYAPDCARVIWSLLETDREIYNVAGPDRVSLYEFGVETARVFGLDTSLIEPVGSDYFPTIAPRPQDTSYDTSKIEKLGLHLLGIREGLAQMKRER